MSLDTTRANPNLLPSTRDDIEDIKQRVQPQYLSGWQRIDAGASVAFTHGLLEIPFAVDVLEAIDSQGREPASASSVTVTKTGKIITVVNGGTARFFRVRAR